jgi:hypothetical protein
MGESYAATTEPTMLVGPKSRCMDWNMVDPETGYTTIIRWKQSDTREYD